MITHLQDEAEVSRGLVFALIVFAVVDVHVVELNEADEVTGGLERKKENESGMFGSYQESQDIF